MCDSGRAGAGGGKASENSLAQVVDGPVPIRAPPRPRYRFSSRRNSPPSLDFLAPPGVGEKGSLELQTVSGWRSCLRAIFSHVPCPSPSISDTHLIVRNSPVPPPS
jgi:hypothetical protein